MNDDDVLEILREVVIEIMDPPGPYESVSAVNARWWAARRRVVDALVAVVKEHGEKR